MGAAVGERRLRVCGEGDLQEWSCCDGCGQEGCGVDVDEVGVFEGFACGGDLDVSGVFLWGAG